MYNNRQFRPFKRNDQKPRHQLDTKSHRVVSLAEKYNLTPKTVGYLRAAMNGTGKYTKESLIKHIDEDNERRIFAMQQNLERTDISKEEAEKLNSYTQINIEFREGIKDVLNRLTPEELSDIIR